MSDFKFSNETYFELDGSFKEGFTVVPNYILNNKNLSYKAVGIYVQILQYQNSPTHKIYMSSLQTYKTDKESSVRSGINELINEGFLTSEAIRNERGQLKGKRYIVHAKPIEKTTIEPKRENPVSENPVSENIVRKSKIGYKENKKKENIEVEEEAKIISLYYETFKLEKRKMPHTLRLLKEYAYKFDFDLWEEIFISASGEDISNKFKYVRSVIEDLVKENIYTLNEYKKRADHRKSTNKPNNIIPQNNNNYSKNKQTKGASSGVNDNFKKYDKDELEKMLQESQKDKFKKDDTVKAESEAIEEKNNNDIEEGVFIPNCPYKTEVQYTKDGQRIDIG